MLFGERRHIYKFLKLVIKQSHKDLWTEFNLRLIDKEFKKFMKKLKIDEIIALRTGEIFLGKYCEVDLKDINDVKDLVSKCCNAIDEISPHVCIVIVGALVRLALSEIDGKHDINEFKEEQ